MNIKDVTALVFAAVATAGCAAAPVQDKASVEGSAEALTVQECATQRDTCIARNPLFGFFTCPVQYTQCVATASNGIPAEVTSAITDAQACASAQAKCLRNANTAAKILACNTTEAQCVADIVDARLPPVVSGTVDCVQDAVACVRASETVNDVAGCGDTLEDCAVDQVVSTLPPEVGQAVTDTRACLDALDDCNIEASTPAQLTACAQTEIRCVATALGVTLPNVPVAEAVQCAEDAANCTSKARSVPDVRACAADLVECNQSIANGPAPLTCQQKWTQCLVANPFNFFQCAAELAACQDN